MPKTTPEQNKAIVLEAFDTLFNKRDYAAAERFWSPKYIQHSAHIAPGREGLFALVRLTPETLRYENQLIVAEGDYVIAHGRFTGMEGPLPGLPPTLSDSKTVFSSNTGMCCKTKRRRPNPSAAFRCLVRVSLHKCLTSGFMDQLRETETEDTTDDRNQEAARESSSDYRWHDRDRVGYRKALCKGGLPTSSSRAVVKGSWTRL